MRRSTPRFTKYPSLVLIRLVLTEIQRFKNVKISIGNRTTSVNLEAIWFEFWMKGAEMTVGIFVFYGWRFSNQLDILSETHFSCDTVDRGLWLAILSSLLCPETDRNIHIGKQGYVSFFTVLKKWCFIPDINQRFSSCFDTSKSWILLNKLISQTFCLLGLLNSRQSNGSRLTKTKFVPRGLVQLD